MYSAGTFCSGWLLVNEKWATLTPCCSCGVKYNQKSWGWGIRYEWGSLSASLWLHPFPPRFPWGTRCWLTLNQNQTVKTTRLCKFLLGGRSFLQTLSSGLAEGWKKKTNGVTVGSTIFCLIEERKFVENCQLMNERKKKPQLNVPFYISSAIEILFFIREMSEFWEGLSVATRRIVRGSRVSESLWCPLGNTYYIHLKVLNWWFNKNLTVKKTETVQVLAQGKMFSTNSVWRWLSMGNNA